MRTLRIGAGAGFAGDRIDPAVELARDGSLDYLVFECLAERTIALAQLNKRNGLNAGYDPLLRERLEAVLPLCARNKVRVVSNMGAANPRAAAEETIAIARELGLDGLRVAWVEGDDVFETIELEPLGLESIKAREAIDPRERLVSANAYLGVEPLIECLRSEADIVLTGRVADPSLFLAPMVYEFGWALDDWDRLGRGTAVGHLLECAGQLTGGYFADPGYKDVADLDRLGFPLAEIDENGDALLTKVAGTGGELTVRNCKEQILYEVHDPSRYLTPDVTADFTAIHFEQEGPDWVRVSGARGTARPVSLKVSTGFYAGFVAEGQISYAGPGAMERAKLAREILERRLGWVPQGNLRLSFIGVDSVHREMLSARVQAPYEVRLRAAGRFFDERQARMLMREVESLYVNGPAGGAGVTVSLRENIAMDATYFPRSAVATKTFCEVA